MDSWRIVNVIYIWLPNSCCKLFNLQKAIKALVAATVAHKDSQRCTTSTEPMTSKVSSASPTKIRPASSK
jgi:hypothetical protein